MKLILEIIILQIHNKISARLYARKYKKKKNLKNVNAMKSSNFKGFLKNTTLLRLRLWKEI